MHGGYVDGLRDELPDAIIDNRSVGASPGLQFACYCGDDLSAFDVIIFDSAVNDENFPDMIGDLRYMKKLLFEMLSTMASQTRVIILGLTNRRYADVDSTIFKLHKDLSQDLGIEFFDGRVFINGIRHTLAEGEPFYEIESHPHRELARKLGRELGKTLRAERRKPVGLTSYALNFYSANMYDIYPKGEVYFKQNRIFAERFMLMPLNEPIFIQDGAVMVGFYLDSCNTRGFLALDGEERRNKRVFYLCDRPEMMVKFVAMRNGCRASTLTLIEYCGEYEDSPHCVPKLDAEPAKRVSISKVAFWKGAE